MSKKEIDFEKLEPNQKLKIKKPETDLDTDKAVKSIHDVKVEKEKTRRITIDIPFSLYVDVRKKVIEEEKTLKDYFLRLAINDLEQKKE
jgi:hypothetical protein